MLNECDMFKAPAMVKFPTIHAKNNAPQRNSSQMAPMSVFLRAWCVFEKNTYIQTKGVFLLSFLSAHCSFDNGHPFSITLAAVMNILVMLCQSYSNKKLTCLISVMAALFTNNAGVVRDQSGFQTAASVFLYVFLFKYRVDLWFAISAENFIRFRSEWMCECANS